VEQPDWKCIQFPVISLVKHKKIRFCFKKITHKKKNARQRREKNNKFSILCLIVEKEKREEKEFLGKEIESLG